MDTSKKPHAIWADSQDACCPICSKRFYKGGIHPADQKLHNHMSSKGKGHRRERDTLIWNTDDWEPI